MINCLITGVGGQGTVLASKLIAEGAMRHGYEVRTTETIGMAQRGGSVVSHVRIGTDIHSPLIAQGQADLIIAFEPAEAVRVLPYLKEGGALVVAKDAVKSIVNPGGYVVADILNYLEQHVPNITFIEGDKICKLCDHPKGLNIALLGAGLKTNILPMTKEDMEDVIKESVKPNFVERNLQILNIGFEEATR